jgi:hypothetical protein
MIGRELLENDQVYIVVALYVIGAAVILLSVVQRSLRTASVGVLVLGLSFLYERLAIYEARKREEEVVVDSGQ